MTVVLVPIITHYGADAVLVVGLLAGLFLVLLGWAGAGRTMRYIPLPVVEGFTIGIAVIIALQQVPPALGVLATAEGVLPTALAALDPWLRAPDWTAPGIAVAVAGPC